MVVRPSARTNLALLTLLLVTLVTGVLAFGLGSVVPARWLAVTHGAAGFAVLLLAPWKAVIVRRGLRRPGTARHAGSLALLLFVAVSIGSGVLHAAGGWRTYLGLLPMQLHVGSAVAAAVVLVLHLTGHRRRQRFRPRRTDLSRRVALRSGALVAGAAAFYLVGPGRERRVTGSHEVGSGDQAAMPVTQWAFDPVLRLEAWRLRAPNRSYGLDELVVLPNRTVRAVLDCTGGWYAEQDWHGVPLAALLPAAAVRGAASIDVISATGYRRRLPVRDLPGLLLATHVADEPLSAGHGGPARLVAPGRRGFWWVKWVTRIEVTDEPWWWQPPFPLQ